MAGRIVEIGGFKYIKVYGFEPQALFLMPQAVFLPPRAFLLLSQALILLPQAPFFPERLKKVPGFAF